VCHEFSLVAITATRAFAAAKFNFNCGSLRYIFNETNKDSI